MLPSSTQLIQYKAVENPGLIEKEKCIETPRINCQVQHRAHTHYGQHRCQLAQLPEESGENPQSQGEDASSTQRLWKGFKTSTLEVRLHDSLISALKSYQLFIACVLHSNVQ